MEREEKRGLRADALNLSVAAVILVLVLGATVGVRALIGGEKRGSADPTYGLGEAGGAEGSVRADAVSAGCLAVCDDAHPWNENQADGVAQNLIPLRCVGNRSYTVGDPSLSLHPEAAEALARLSRDLSAYAPGVTLCVTGAYRDWRGAGGDAGRTEDHTGYRVTCTLTYRAEGGVRSLELSAAQDDPATRPAALWLAAHRPDYGFIAGVAGGLRYVGAPHAAYMEAHRLTLSAYLDLLRGYTKENPLSVGETERGAAGEGWFAGQTFCWFVPADHGAAVVTVPQGAAFRLSGNGSDGFIVTLYREA